jgi:hypothetical protein
VWRIRTADGRTAVCCGDDEAARDEMVAELFTATGADVVVEEVDEPA